LFVRASLLVSSFGVSVALARTAEATTGATAAATAETEATTAEAEAPSARPLRVTAAADAPAAPRSRGVTALVTGLATAGASLAYGGFLLTSGHGLSAQHDGLYVMSLGLTLAPFVAHGVADEWARGALFSIAPAVGGIGMAMLLAKRPDAAIRGKQKSQRIYPVLITVSTLGSAVGIFDAALADQRLPDVRVAVGDGYAGAELAGSF
jgi:hypothetical protein